VPTYEYRCPDGHEFEQFVQKISLASSELACPVCGKMAARQMSAGGGFLFKGSGFYITDYGKDGKKDERDKVEKAATAKSDAAATAEKGRAATAGTDASAVKATPSEKSGEKGGTGDKGRSREKAARSERSESPASGGNTAGKKTPPVTPPSAGTKKEGGQD
jgi:putative FmdB family regulatory protein